MEYVLMYAPLASLGLVAVYVVSTFVVKLVKHKSIKKAVAETAKTLEKYTEVAESELQYRLKEICRAGIYTNEALFRTYNGKAGAFKLDSLLKDMQVACLQYGVEYDRQYWVDYIQQEILLMKGVK